jgi:LytS/YehU family sensor histidine kinase
MVTSKTAASDSTGSSLAYWVCQSVGWSSFALYILTFATLYAGLHLGVVIEIVLIDGVLCLLLTHGLRWWMRRRGWILMSAHRLLPRLVAVMVLLSAFLTGLVLLVATTILHSVHPRDSGFLVSVFVGFMFALGCWLGIYFWVRGRRSKRALEMQALQLQVIARDSQMHALQGQLNPHFLFNCLNSLRALIVEDPERAQTMVTRIADLLRRSLRTNPAETIPLQEEMVAVNDYLDLEHVRFEDRLRVSCFLEPRALPCRVPPMIVQTLVENGLKHGIAHLPEGGKLHIAARVVNDRLQIEVINSGKLYSEADRTGSGLHNARERLRLIYGDSASLMLAARDSNNVVATLEIPLRIPPDAATAQPEATSAVGAER